MTDSPIEAFVPLAEKHCPGAPHPVVREAIRAAAAEWCVRTRCWRWRAAVSFATDTVAPPLPAGAVISEIERALVEREELEPTPWAEMPLAETGAPKRVSMADPTQVTISPFIACTVDLHLFLRPPEAMSVADPGAAPGAPRTDRLPTFLLQQAGEAIGRGAAARVLEIADQVFSNPERAAMNRELFERAMNARFREHARGRQRARLRTTVNWF